MEAFSDGVVAILITIMVLDLKVPRGTALADLVPLAPVFVSYVMSFAFLGTYWNNHHHLLQAAKVVDGRVLWANLLLLFSLSMFPFTTAWMGETVFAPIPTAVYGAVALAAAIAYYLLIRALVSAVGQPPSLAAAIGSDWKGKASLILYAAAVPCALSAPMIAVGLYVVVECMWVVPDLRFERTLAH